MPISFHKNKFHLYNRRISYVMEVSEYKDLLHLYWGKRVNSDDLTYPRVVRPGMVTKSDNNDHKYSLEVLPQEYPMFGEQDLRMPACSVETVNGNTISQLKYKSYEIVKGKPSLDGLPSVYTESDEEADTLIITCEDKANGFEARLFYTIYQELDVICRHAEITNINNLSLFLHSVQSMSIDLPSMDYQYLHLPGAWTREKQIEINPIHRGTQGFDSKRGASSHVENPFIAIMEKNACEDSGSVYGISLIYSGNFRFNLEADQYEQTRVQAGINPFGFRWKLEEGETFTAPEAVMVYSENGLGAMSRIYHKLYRTRLCRGQWRDRERPVLINNWEGTYFDFNEEKLLAIADSAKKIGVELFVLDDGWFGCRNDDTTSLGDWVVNKEKLPAGLDSLARKINERGLKFGLWFEPEMVSPESELYKKHPDWAISVPGRIPHLARNQMILNLGREDVCEYIINAVGSVLESANIEYVKWDMNRYMTDIYSTYLPEDRQGETAHRYILGLYKILDALTEKFPHVLFEGCASGGGRNDGAMLAYMPQNWASDMTDAVERMRIQYGTSIVYPASTMGAHVSAVPNHQIHRVTPLKYRGVMAMSGMFGYELDLAAVPDEEIREMTDQVEQYKRIRPIVMFGDMYRLMNPFEERSGAWMYVSEDQEKAVVFFADQRAVCNEPLRKFKLKGLDPDRVYRVNGVEYTGNTLMNFGLWRPIKGGDYECEIYEIEAV